MGDNRTDLPEGTDTVIAGASGSDDVSTNAGTTENALVAETKTPATRGSSDKGLRDRIRDGGERLSNEATDRARGLVGQGLERSAEALANVSKLVGDTADGLDERLGSEYGDYARKAASAIESTANNLASKNPDELIEDTRNFIRNSPGLAVAGAAIVGFVVARLVKSGLSNDRDDD
ncbi:MAG: hypothetical protein HOP96_07025 [Sphingomonas sp.]|nr:hypothetical protein [Sphingomonas sp.]